MKKLVGKYQLGFRNVLLYVVSDSADGSVDLLPKDKGPSVIYVGIDGPFYDCVGTLLHEAYELVLIDLNTRHKKQPSYSLESSDFIFIASHNELSEAHERVGTFIASVYGEFGDAYNKNSRFLNRKRKK